MIPFLLGLAFLLAGYFFWGSLTAASVKPDPTRPTPCVLQADGIDFVPMPTWRIYLIQLLNIAGLGPIFGPIMGALWGPQVFLWILFGTVLGGAVHDFYSGAMSMRNQGEGLPDLIGRYLGHPLRHAATLFILVLMVLVGTVFVKGPAMLVVKLLPAATVGGWFGAPEALAGAWQGQTTWMWIVMGIIFAYYVAATLLPIDQLIGRIYPIFAVALLVMVAGLTVAILAGQFELPAFTLANLHPEGTPPWPVIFITVSCGAVSGFHATQSPLMARCLKSERHMKLVFYGAMVAEGFIALVWACAAQGFYEGPAALQAVLTQGGPSQVVFDVCVSTMGVVGGALAILGVVVLPITSGDTAFRVGRLILADYLKLSQKKVANRYLIAVPMFAVSLALNFVNFDVIWRYFGWANQALAVFTLWAAAVFLARRGNWWWLAVPPAIFMTVMTTTYILVEEVGFGLDRGLGTGLGIGSGVLTLAVFLVALRRLEPEDDRLEPVRALSEADEAIDRVGM